MTASLPHPGQRTPSGQRCWRTSAKHLASSNSSERLTRSDEGMTARAPCATAAADQPPASSQQKPHATATRSPASQHPGSQQEPLWIRLSMRREWHYRENGREPFRVSRRLQLLRDWSHDEANPTLFT